MTSFEDILGWIGAIINVSIFLFPAIPFINVFKGKLNYENTPMMQIFTGYCNCFAWYYFAYFYHYDQIKICNIIGLISYLLLITTYLAYETKKYLVDAILNALLIFNGTWAAYKALNDVLTTWETIENVCFGTTCVYNIYHLHLIYRVIKEKNYKIIPVKTAIASILSGICWIIFGISYLNYIISKCHAIGILVSVAEIVVCHIYKKKYQSIEQISEIDTIGIENYGSDEGGNKIMKTVPVKLDDDEDDKIKQKPVVILFNRDENK